MLHQPIARLRQGGDRDGHVDAVRELFALDEVASDALLTDDLSPPDDGSEAARSDG